MRKQAFLGMSLIAATLVFMGCSNDNGPAALENLKPVQFNAVADKVISSEPTEDVSGGKRILRQVVRKQMTLAPVQLVTADLSEVIYPGCVLRGDHFMEGDYTPVPITNPQPIKISATLLGKGIDASEETPPVLSNVRASINKILFPNKGMIKYDNAPAYMTYQSNEVDTEESFEKTFGIHVKASVLKGINSAHFDYNYNKTKSHKKKYVLIKVRQHLYSIAVDTKDPNSWGKFGELGEYEPVYVSNVDYGRVLHLLVETTEDAETTTKSIKAGVSAAFLNYSGSVDTKIVDKCKDLFKEQKIRILVAGGPLSNSKTVTSYESFIDAIKSPSAQSLIESAVPISYRVRSLRSNREVEVRACYTEVKFVPEK